MRIRVIAILFVILLGVQAAVLAAPLPPEITAEAGYLIVIDNKSNPMLFGKNQDKIMYPASTTKIMTLLLALEKGNLNSVVTVSPKAASCEESRLGLEAGNQLTLRELLKGMMAVSGNDAAEAVAEHIGGSIDGFADMMNAEAERLGAKRTHFTNPHGLPDPINHFTTAHDLGVITAYALKQPGFIDFVSKPEQTVTFIEPNTTITVHNTNRLLKTYKGANGVKTGTTEEAGNCLVASAKRGNIQLIAVVLKSDDTVEDCRWQDASDLLDYGFNVLSEKK
jgi:D-alanyl-D-alanine carboxypeptidase (penicillin-binding protein 5/6)